MKEKTSGALIEHLKSYSAIEFALLFGSHALEKQRPNSDINSAIYLNRALSFEEVLDLSLDLKKIVGCEVDIVILNEASPLHSQF